MVIVTVDIVTALQSALMEKVQQIVASSLKKTITILVYYGTNHLMD